MRAEVKRDNVSRTIVITVSGVPDVDITASYHKNPRIFRPDTVQIRLMDGELGGLNVSGPLVLKSGGVSASVRDHQRWYASRTTAGMPAWLAQLVNEAPAGVTSWNEPEAQTL